ncbi:MAG: nitroreductase family protein [Eubacteriales bacterium]|nr:nitroreductase family protein [Eubacteriales bacterium]
MDVLQAIKTRRSIRKYSDVPVTDQQVDALLEAGFCAPSARNIRPWHFIVARDAQKRRQIAQAHPYAKMLEQPQAVLFVVCGDLNKQPSPEYCAEDCSAAVQNMLLAAHGLGLGAVWLGTYPNADRVEAVRGVFDVPADILPIAMVAVGHPAEVRDIPQRFDAACVHRETW